MPPRDCESLGFAFTGKRVTITVAPKKPFHPEELSPFVLNRHVRGWTGYCGLAQQFDLFDKLDGGRVQSQHRAAGFGCASGIGKCRLTASGDLHARRLREIASAARTLRVWG